MYYIKIRDKEVIISEEMVIKYNLQAGNITPFTRCKIMSNEEIGDNISTIKNSKSTSDIIKIPDKTIISATDIIKAEEKQRLTADIIKIENKQESEADIIKIKG